LAFQRSLKLWFEDVTYAVSLLNRYLHVEDYTGKWFDRIGPESKPDEITAADLVAVSCLGVSIPADTAIWLLGEGQAQVNGLLSRIPRDLCLREATDDHIGETSPAWQLWDLLDEATWRHDARDPRMGPTKKSKLIARKRPHLIPIWDSRVSEALGADLDGHWNDMREELQCVDLYGLVTEARREADAEHLSMLRTIDIVVWMSETNGEPPPAL
jgi:hypothetical protein